MEKICVKSKLEGASTPNNTSWTNDVCDLQLALSFGGRQVYIGFKQVDSRLSLEELIDPIVACSQAKSTMIICLDQVNFHRFHSYIIMCQLERNWRTRGEAKHLEGRLKLQNKSSNELTNVLIT